MAERSSAISILLFAFTFSLYIDSALSRSLTTTAKLDVSASIQQTHDVLSFDSKSLKQQQEEHEQQIATTSLYLSLYPRSAIHKPHHKDYKSLTLSRLARDSARVDYISAKLDLVINGSNRSTDLAPEAFQTPVTSGLSQGSGEYFIQVGVGSPVKFFYMAIDTGSDIIWLQCKPCTFCYNQSDSIFDPAGSSSYRPISCRSNQCSSLKDSFCYYKPYTSSCQYQVSYEDGSYSTGDFATETVSFRESGSVGNISIGCGHKNTGLLVGSAGFIGLGGGTFSLPSQIKSTSFSYCLVNRDTSSSSTLEFNSAPPSDSFTVPLLRNPKLPTYLYVGSLAGISVGGTMVSIPPAMFQLHGSGDGGVIVDSGTVLTRLQTQAYNSLRNSFVQMTQHLPSTNSSDLLLDTCYDLSSWMERGINDLPSVPIVAFHFTGGGTLPLKPHNVLIPIESDGKFCFAFSPWKNKLSVIGNIQQQGTRVSFDLANSLVGFSTDKC